MTVKFIRSAPVLEVADVQKSAAFYKEKLGFEVIGIWGEPVCFSIVRRDLVTLLLDQSRQTRSAPTNQYWAAYVYVDDVDAYEAELRSRQVEILRREEKTEYGCSEIDVRDPDGHIICFGQDVAPGPEGPGL